jgi:DNA-binding NtrC family response regulator
MTRPKIAPPPLDKHPGFRKLPMTALIDLQPELAKETIIATYRASGADMARTAEALDCTWRTLYRWVGRLGLAEVLEDIKAWDESATNLKTKVAP